MTELWCGIDVAKAQLEVYVETAPGTGGTCTVPNTGRGHAHLVRTLPPAVPVVLEPTGAYHHALVAALQAAGRAVPLVNPARGRRFVQARGRGDKTDRLDAQALVAFARAVPTRLCAPPDPVRQDLAALYTRRQQLAAHLAGERCRLAQTPAGAARASVQRLVRSLERERARVQRALEARVQQTPALAHDAALLQTIPGVGPGLARTLLATLPDLRTFRDTAELAAFVGVAPVLHHSGTSVHRAALPAAGKPRVRSALFFPTLAAVRSNPDVRALYARLRTRGRPKMLALGACMHKLLRICYGVLKHQRPYQPQGT